MFLLSALMASPLASAQADKQCLSTYPAGYPQTDRTKICINSDWKFKLGDPNADYYRSQTDDQDWQEVTVPHTLELTDIQLNGYKDSKSQETFMRKVGWYRRDVFVAQSDKRIYLDFEGVHQVTTLWVNGIKVGKHSVGGYTPFMYDITDYVEKGKDNQITVLADNRVSEITPPDPGPFDYIKFSGLYRDVYLVEKNLLHITSNLESMNSGVTITTPSVDYVNGNATIDIRTEIHNQGSQTKKATIVQRVVDAKGEVVLKLTETCDIAPGTRHRFAQIGGIDNNVKFWSTSHPNLYKVNTTLYDEAGKAIDVVDNRLGIRKVEYDPETGFRLNGEHIKLVGFNRHQHFAYIGDAVPNSLHYRDMIQFKNLGLNCMRTAHYPQDDEIIKACDELGILVYEEVPTWIGIPKEKEWYANLQRSMQAMIRNHKNSPSVIIWGAGLNHRGAVAESQFVAKQEDPTRLTSSQSSRWTGWQASHWADIFANMNYGPGIWSREEPLLGMEGPFGPEALAPYFRDPKMPGMISWTAHAYYTFHIFDSDNSMGVRTRLGAMDAFRYTKDDYLYWYPAEFKSEPYIHVREDWTPSLDMLTVYSNATEIEVFVNGVSQGRFQPSRAAKYKGLSHPPFEIDDFAYADGELKVVGYRDNARMAEEVVTTPQEATRLNLIADQLDIDMKADGNDIVVVHAEVLDENGVRIRDYAGEIEFKVKGDASIIGDEIEQGFNPVIIRNGVGSALVRAGKKAGKIEVSANSKGLKSSSIALKSVASHSDIMLAQAYPIKDKECIMLDLGANSQLTQFGWTSWDAENQNKSQISVLPSVLGNYVAGDTPAASDPIEMVAQDTKGAYTFIVRTNSSKGVLRWLGEMNVIGRDNFVYGDGVLGIDKEGITLEIDNLPLGDYALKTYHHAPSANTDSMDPNLERLKTESIHKLPFAKEINIFVNDQLVREGIRPSSGRECQTSDPTTAVVKFSVKNQGEVVSLRFKSNDQNNAGVWLNGFEFVRYL